eukprot:599370-Amphidinium_carterae.1
MNRCCRCWKHKLGNDDVGGTERDRLGGLSEQAVIHSQMEDARLWQRISQCIQTAVGCNCDRIGGRSLRVWHEQPATQMLGNLTTSE